MVQDLTVFKLDETPLTPIHFFNTELAVNEIFVDDKRRIVMEIVEGESGGVFEWRIPGESILYFFEGRERIENLDTGKTIEAEKGDVVIYPKGCNARATYLEPVRVLIVRWCEEGNVPGWPTKE